MTRRLVLTALFATLPVTAQAQTQGQAQAQGSAAAQARIEAALETAVEAGIPMTLLERKVAEGRAKRVPLERIAVAVETRLEALVHARDVLQRAHLQSTTEGELSLAADAVQAGVSESALLSVTSRAPQERRAVAVAVLADLVALGHGNEHALAQVTAAMNRSTEALVNLQARTAGEMRARGNAGAAAGVSVGASGGVRIDLGRGKGKGTGK